MINKNEINSFEVHFEYICSTFDRLRENGTNPWNVKKGAWHHYYNNLFDARVCIKIYIFQMVTYICNVCI